MKTLFWITFTASVVLGSLGFVPSIQQVVEEVDFGPFMVLATFASMAFAWLTDQLATRTSWQIPTLARLLARGLLIPWGILFLASFLFPSALGKSRHLAFAAVLLAYCAAAIVRPRSNAPPPN